MRRGSRFGPHGARRRRSLTSRTLLHMWRTRPDGRSRRHGCARAGGAVARTPASEALRESRPASRARRRGGPRRDRARPLHPTALPRQALSCPWAPGAIPAATPLPNRDRPLQDGGDPARGPWRMAGRCGFGTTLEWVWWFNPIAGSAGSATFTDRDVLPSFGDSGTGLGTQVARSPVNAESASSAGDRPGLPAFGHISTCRWFST